MDDVETFPDKVLSVMSQHLNVQYGKSTGITTIRIIIIPKLIVFNWKTYLYMFIIILDQDLLLCHYPCKHLYSEYKSC